MVRKMSREYQRERGINGDGKRNIGVMTLAKGVDVSIDDYEKRINNNVLIFGSPGSGKTTLIKKQLLNPSGSYIISDPKGRLYAEFKEPLKKKGYEVININFKNLKETNHFNPLLFLKTEEDVLRFSRIITDQFISERDIFWDEVSNILISAIVGYLVFECKPQMRTIRNVITMLNMAASTRDADVKSELDILFDKIKKKNEDSWPLRQYMRYRGMATKTMLSVIITAQSKLASFDTNDIHEMISENDFDIGDIGKKKTVVFISVSDTDRSMDALASLFFNIAIQELVKVADEEFDGRLPLPTRFIMDDFGTSIKIDEYPRITASIRSRNLSVWTILQSKGQLESAYGRDGDTIISAHDTLIYQGCNDLETNKFIAAKGNFSIERVNGLEIGNSIIFVRGSKALFAKSLEYEDIESEKENDAAFFKGVIEKKPKVF